MKNTALVTGASGGIGRDLATIHAAQGGDLVIVARSGDELEQLKSELETEHGTTVLCLAEDLTAEGAIERIHEAIKKENIEIEVLINNAGFGGHGLFHQREWAKDEAMIELNVTALAKLTHVILQDMVPRKRGKILNVASTAGMVPGPLQATYYATKAFVLSFSQALAEELADSNITVTALCPGPVKTGFADRANMEGIDAFEKNAADSMSVAKLGYSAMQKGKLVVINDWMLSIVLNWLVPLMPRRWVLKFSRQAMEKN